MHSWENVSHTWAMAVCLSVILLNTHQAPRTNQRVQLTTLTATECSTRDNTSRLRAAGLPWAYVPFRHVYWGQDLTKLISFTVLSKTFSSETGTLLFFKWAHTGEDHSDHRYSLHPLPWFWFQHFYPPWFWHSGCKHQHREKASDPLDCYESSLDHWKGLRRLYTMLWNLSNEKDRSISFAADGHCIKQFHLLC